MKLVLSPYEHEALKARAAQVSPADPRVAVWARSVVLTEVGMGELWRYPGLADQWHRACGLDPDDETSPRRWAVGWRDVDGEEYLLVGGWTSVEADPARHAWHGSRLVAYRAEDVDRWAGAERRPTWDRVQRAPVGNGLAVRVYQTANVVLLDGGAPALSPEVRDALDAGLRRPGEPSAWREWDLAEALAAWRALGGAG